MKTLVRLFVYQNHVWKPHLVRVAQCEMGVVSKVKYCLTVHGATIDFAENSPILLGVQLFRMFVFPLLFG